MPNTDTASAEAPQKPSEGPSGRAAFLLVSGPRELRQQRLVEAALDEAWADARRLGFPELIVVHGAARGADELADRWAQRRARQGVSRRRFRADWEGPCGEGCWPGHRQVRGDGSSFCPAEGLRRNQRMVEHVLAEAPPGGAMALVFLVNGLPCRGSKDALRRIQGSGLPHRVVTANRGRL